MSKELPDLNKFVTKWYQLPEMIYTIKYISTDKPDTIFTSPVGFVPYEFFVEMFPDCTMNNHMAPTTIRNSDGNIVAEITAK